jgi:hypothetical protein
MPRKYLSADAVNGPAQAELTTDADEGNNQPESDGGVVDFGDDLEYLNLYDTGC